MILWVPTETDAARVDAFSVQYVEKEAKGASGRRGDVGPHRMAHVQMGKYAELAWADLTGGEPDFDIWAGNSADPDIVDTPENPLQGAFTGKRLHVKSCHVKWFGTRYDSWTASRYDKMRLDPTPDDVILLAYADPDGGDVMRIGWVYAVDVQHLWKRCHAPALAHKDALYWNDIQIFVNQISD